MSTANVPMATIGPIKIIGEEVNEEISVPLATFETPLWPSTNRGAKLSRLCQGIRATVIDERMTRSVVFESENAMLANKALLSLKQREPDLHEIVGQSSRYAVLLNMHSQIVGNLLFLRFEFKTGDASGHNMVTQSAQRLMEWILSEYSDLKYVSISGNFCTDKKVSAVNGIYGRGKNVVAEMMIPNNICVKHLHTTPEALDALNIKKNLIGTSIAGGLRSANAHFANMLLALYLATGQDAANIVEGSQGMVYTQVKPEGLYFSVTIPNIIVGTVGNGKGLDFVQENLRLLGCLEDRKPGENARRLAIITAATVLCGELSLLAAQTNPGELMRSHIAIERGGEVEYRQS